MLAMVVVSAWETQRWTGYCGHASPSGGRCVEVLAAGKSLHKSTYLAGDLQGLENLRLKHASSQAQREDANHERPWRIRSSYSPFVESLGPVSRAPDIVLDNAQDLSRERLTGFSPAESLSSEEIVGSLRNDGDISEDSQNVEEDARPQDPVAAAHGDLAKVPDAGLDVNVKRSARSRPPSMSLSQGFTMAGGRAVHHTVGAIGRPVSSAKAIKGGGPAGVAVGAAVAVLGLVTAIVNSGQSSGFRSPQKVCNKCDGFGVQCCHICQGRGKISWEGKLKHADPCPLCFGSCTEKCARCGGARRKKGTPSWMLPQISKKRRA